MPSRAPSTKWLLCYCVISMILIRISKFCHLGGAAQGAGRNKALLTPLGLWGQRSGPALGTVGAGALASFLLCLAVDLGDSLHCLNPVFTTQPHWDSVACTVQAQGLGTCPA